MKNPYDNDVVNLAWNLDAMIANIRQSKPRVKEWLHPLMAAILDHSLAANFNAPPVVLLESGRPAPRGSRHHYADDPSWDYHLPNWPDQELDDSTGFPGDDDESARNGPVDPAFRRLYGGITTHRQCADLARQIENKKGLPPHSLVVVALGFYHFDNPSIAGVAAIHAYGQDTDGRPDLSADYLTEAESLDNLRKHLPVVDAWVRRLGGADECAEAPDIIPDDPDMLPPDPMSWDVREVVRQAVHKWQWKNSVDLAELIRAHWKRTISNGQIRNHMGGKKGLIIIEGFRSRGKGRSTGYGPPL